MELDFYLQLWWQEPRLNMPAYWNKMDEANISNKEVHLDRIFYDPAGSHQPLLTNQNPE